MIDRFRIDVHLTPDDLAAALREEVRTGFTSTPKVLSPKWFYDKRGSDLFDEITRLPEYYPTRAERAILERWAPEIAAGTAADTLIELGSGTSEKTRLLLDAMTVGGQLTRFAPFDVDEATLRGAAESILKEYPDLAVHAVVGDFEHHLDELPTGGSRLIAFLGGTIGNLEPEPRARFLATLAGSMGPDDWLLLGTDLVKDEARLVRAYDDAAGVTAAFNKNVLEVLNRAVGAHFDPDTFEHVALWNTECEWIEMRLRSRHAQVISIDDLELDAGFEAGEDLRTEISVKFRPEKVQAELAAAGLEMGVWWTDPAGDFALSLASRRGT